LYERELTVFAASANKSPPSAGFLTINRAVAYQAETAAAMAAALNQYREKRGE